MHTLEAKDMLRTHRSLSEVLLPPPRSWAPGVDRLSAHELSFVTGVGRELIMEIGGAIRPVVCCPQPFQEK